MDAIRALFAGGGVAATALVVALVFGLFLLRASVVTPLATVVALEYGLAAPALLVLRALSSVALALLIGWAVGRWRDRGRRTVSSPGRIGRAPARAQGMVAGGNVVANFLLLGYVLNSYVAFGLVATLRPARERALLAAILGELVAFTLSLGAVLGLGTALPLSPLQLTAVTTGLALALAAVPAAIRRAWPAGVAPLPRPR